MFYTALVRSWYGLGIAMTPSLTRIRHNNTKKPRRLVRLGCVCFRFLGFALDFQLIGQKNQTLRSCIKIFHQNEMKTKKIKKKMLFLPV